MSDFKIYLSLETSMSQSQGNPDAIWEVLCERGFLSSPSSKEEWEKIALGGIFPMHSVQLTVSTWSFR